MSGGTIDPRRLDLATTVVVPSRPGPVIRLADAHRDRDEVDVLLDDVFGSPDEAAAGPIDAVLLLAGAAAVIAFLTSLAPPWVLVAGVAAFGLGAVLPLRSFWRRAAAARRTAQLRAAIGDGAVLRADHPCVVALLAANDRCTASAGAVAAWRRVQVHAVAHAALVEVATLLDGREPGSDTEVRDVEARTAALRELADALDAPADAAHRHARAEARPEVERIAGGSAVEDAGALTRDLREAP